MKSLRRKQWRKRRKQTRESWLIHNPCLTRTHSIVIPRYNILHIYKHYTPSQTTAQFLKISRSSERSLCK
jgi:hypothetical protein